MTIIYKVRLQMITRLRDGSRIILKRGLEIPKMRIRKRRTREKLLGRLGTCPPENPSFSNIMKHYLLHFQGRSTTKCDHKHWLLLPISSLYAAAVKSGFELLFQFYLSNQSVTKQLLTAYIRPRL